MRKNVVLAALFVGALLGSRVFVQAAFTSDITSQATAVAVLNSPNTLTVTIENVADNNPAAQLGWTSPTNIWVESNQCFKIAYASNEVNWGIQIYTDNKNGAASPAYTGNTSAGYEGAGLIGVTDSTVYVPMAWTALTAKGSRPTLTTDVNGVLLSNNGYAYFKDKLQSTFSAGNDYITVVNTSGLAKNDGTGRNSSAVSPVYVYIDANFRGVANQTYRTNQLVIELFHQ
jgi:hypothetical protein